MPDSILITGGAGFIGSHLTRALLEMGHRVRVLDSLIDQVHPGGEPPADFPKDAELVVGDVRDEAALDRALQDVDKVVHLAAEVGVGQSMYAVERYVSVNDLGTASLFQKLIDKDVRRVVVASSMSIYGEGLYRTRDGRPVEQAVRVPRASADATWDPLDPDGNPLIPVPTPEWKRPSLASVYALTKYVQEQLDAHAVARLRHRRRRATAVQCLRARPGSFQPLHRRARHLRLASAERAASHGVRRRPPAPGLCPR